MPTPAMRAHSQGGPAQQLHAGSDGDEVGSDVEGVRGDQSDQQDTDNHPCWAAAPSGGDQLAQAPAELTAFVGSSVRRKAVGLVAYNRAPWQGEGRPVNPAEAAGLTV